MSNRRNNTSKGTRIETRKCLDDEEGHNDTQQSPTTKEDITDPLPTITTSNFFNPLTGVNNDTVINDDIIDTYFSHGGSSGSLMYPNVNTDMIHNKESELKSIYHGLFDYWYSQLKSGFNILLYGLGSKMTLLDEFCKSKLSSSCTMSVYGFFPDVTIKDILNTITTDIFEHSGRFKSTSLHCQYISSSLQDKSEIKELYLIIHNIDGKPLQDKRTQHALSLLATCPFIHIIASIDHPRAPLLWDEKTMQHFNWVWHHSPTYEEYSIELSYHKTTVSNDSDALVLTSVTHVLSSLTSNARGVFSVLANYQLEHKDESSYTGLSFSELYQKCREKFLVSSDVSLRAQLTEFKDHKIIQFKKGQDGAELICVTLKTTLIEQLLSEQAINL